MKKIKGLLFILSALLILSFKTNDCKDCILYANKKQTEFDKRFDEYTKIKSVPKYKGGEKKLDEYIRSKLKLSDIAKTQIFFLNYQFTLTCDGKIENIKQLGDPKGKDWTNIIEIIQSTDGYWTSAKKDRETVNCIYFRSMFINGKQY